jgi:hypothetical protein
MHGTSHPFSLLLKLLLCELEFVLRREGREDKIDGRLAVLEGRKGREWKGRRK